MCDKKAVANIPPPRDPEEVYQEAQRIAEANRKTMESRKTGTDFLNDVCMR